MQGNNVTPKDKLKLEQISKMVNHQGDYCDYGCSEEMVNKMISLAKEMFPNKPCCVVGRWCWVDIELEPQDENALMTAGLNPSFIYASRVISDDRQRWEENTCIRTTLLQKFHHQSIFSSQNTNYILCGPGVRISVIPAVYSDFTLYG
tara:strand:+ start:22052 stop:22495 length:444 start_codon:yes stop_codon:yes gene_type:complete